MKNYLIWIALGAIVMANCANPPAKGQEETVENESAASSPQMTEPALPEIAADAPRLSNNAYDYTVFLPLFPEILSFSGRQNTGGENYKMGAGFVASASASYSHNDRRFSVTIHDVGNNPELISDMAKWSTFTVDEDTESEFQKSYIIDGNPAFKHYDKQRRAGSINIVYKGRFVVDITGRNIEMADLDKALDDLHIERLK